MNSGSHQLKFGSVHRSVPSLQSPTSDGFKKKKVSHERARPTNARREAFDLHAAVFIALLLTKRSFLGGLWSGDGERRGRGALAKLRRGQARQCASIPTAPDQRRKKTTTRSTTAATTPPLATTIHPTRLSLMASSTTSTRGKTRPGVVPIIGSFVPLLLLLLVSSSSPVAFVSAKDVARGNANGNSSATSWALFRPKEEVRAFRRIMARVARLEKASNKTIQSPDGDVILCVPKHRQPAFDHPKLRGHKLEDEPVERPKPKGGGGAEDEAKADAVFPQAWTDGGESCPEGTVPVRRTTERDVLRASSARRFGMKPRASNVRRRDSTSSGHEHAVGYVTGDQFYGAKASLNVWSARVASPAEFSLSQIWVISGSFGNDLNTIEAGWQVSPELYGDSNPRFFTYWTTDAYQETGCYNLHCSGFVQTNNRIAIGAAISPTSVYNGRQYDISLLVWKDPRRGHWWLQLGSGALVGYWPSSLFTHLGAHANMVQFGGEVVNSRPSGAHTPTQMGSGHFPREGANRAAYFRNVQVVDWDNSLVPAAALRLVADHPQCYDIRGGYNRAWGNYFYYGGPGRNVHCP